MENATKKLFNDAFATIERIGSPIIVGANYKIRCDKVGKDSEIFFYSTDSDALEIFGKKSKDLTSFYKYDDRETEGHYEDFANLAHKPVKFLDEAFQCGNVIVLQTPQFANGRRINDRDVVIIASKDRDLLNDYLIPLIYPTSATDISKRWAGVECSAVVDGIQCLDHKLFDHDNCHPNFKKGNLDIDLIGYCCMTEIRKAHEKNQEMGD